MEEMKIKFFGEFLRNKDSLLKESQSNYPAGADRDPSAPWNQKELDLKSKGRSKSPASLEFKVVDSDGEFVLFQDKKKPLDLYISYIGDPDLNGLEEYRSYTEEAMGRDEDGDMEYEREYEDGFSEEDLEDWAFDNIQNKDIGVGVDDEESGDFMTVKLDEELAQEYYDNFAKWSSRSYRSQSKHFKDMPPRNIVLSYKDMMETIKKSFPSVNSEWED